MGRRGGLPRSRVYSCGQLHHVRWLRDKLDKAALGTSRAGICFTPDLSPSRWETGSTFAQSACSGRLRADPTATCFSSSYPAGTTRSRQSDPVVPR